VNVVNSNSIFQLQKADERAFFDHGWLKTYHSFSFADYYDPKNENWGALRVLNDDTVAPGEGFGTHPHRDMEIVTYVLEGELEHKDSIGNAGVVHPGGVQYMSAGTGIRHSEFNHSRTKPLHFLQMWVIPGKLGVPPTYGQAEFSDDERRNTWLVVASGRSSLAAAVRLTQDAAFLVTRLEGDHSLRHTFEANRLGFLFVAHGSLDAAASLNGDTVGASRLTSGDAVRISNVERMTIQGSGLAVLWDVPPV
jgi:quercetin 2,3-dioxygenase